MNIPIKEAYKIEKEKWEPFICLECGLIRTPYLSKTRGISLEYNYKGKRVCRNCYSRLKYKENKHKIFKIALAGKHNFKSVRNG